MLFPLDMKYELLAKNLEFEFKLGGLNNIFTCSVKFNEKEDTKDYACLIKFNNLDYKRYLRCKLLDGFDT